MTSNLQTPLEKLISEKNKVQEQCKIQQQKLNDDFTFIQGNAGKLLLSGLSSLFFAESKTSSKKQKGNTTSTFNNQTATPLAISDYFAIAKGILPIAWEIIQPIIMTWGIKKAKNWFSNHLFKKKK